VIGRLFPVALLVAVTACSSGSTPAPIAGNAPRFLGAFLERAANTDNISNIVATPGGYEAATWTQGETKVVGGRKYRHRVMPVGHVYFWRASRASSEWTKIAASTYPAYAAPPGECRPTIQGGLVAGGSDAVFVVQACITGDGVLNAVAYANGARGWGLIRTLKDGNLASRGQATVLTRDFMRPASAARFEMDFKDHELVTVDRTGYFSDAGDGLFPRKTYWRWDGGELRSIASDAFIAEAVEAPRFHTAPLPRAGCPATGRFAVAFAPTFIWRGRHGPDEPIDLTIAPLHRRRGGTCPAGVPADTPMVVEVGHAAHRFALHPGPVTDRRWVTAPAWMLLIHTLGFHDGPRIPLIVGPNADETSPYVVPSALHVNVMLVRGGGALTKRYPVRVDRMAHGVVTYLRGKVVGLAVRP
jgi:hypothetical protein